MLFRISFLISILVAACPLWGQAPQKKILTEENFKLWHSIDLEAVSKDGNWISYIKQYKGLCDTLFINSIKPSLKYSYPGGKSGRFGKDFFICMLPDSTVSISNLSSGRIVSLKQYSNYNLGLEGCRIIAVKGFQNLKNIIIYDNTGRKLDSVTNITEYVISKNDRYMAFVEKNRSGSSLKSYDLLKGKSEILYETPDEILNIVFGETEKYVAFFSGRISDADTVHLIDRFSGIHNSYAMSGMENFKILLNKKLKISRDGSKVFFDTYRTPLIPKTDSKVEVWHSFDRIIYPIREIRSTNKDFNFSVWYPQRGDLRRYGKTREIAQLSGRQNYSVFYSNGLQGQDGNRYNINSIFVESLDTGKRVLAIKDIVMEKSRVSLCPSNDKMVYYYNNEWWCYDMKLEKHISLTSSIEGQWDDTIEARTQPDVYAAPLWTKDGRSVLLQDKNDLWIVSSDGNSARRITDGKERNIEFLIDYYSLNRSKESQPYMNLQYPSISLQEQLFLSGRGSNKEQGYFVLQYGKMPKKLFYGNFAADQLYLSEKGRYFAKIQSFDLPPSLSWTDGPEKHIHTAVISNPQHSKYDWGKSKLITYRIPDGRFLKAALLYPAGYDPAKKYPMIVKVYQSMSYHVHEYMIPSEYDDIGFNPVNYTLDGYLVLLPDIGYVYGRTGISAAESVEAAVNKVKEMGIVDNQSIGLFGHSFGGYEVNFIMTRSSSFSAAVSGAGISDIISHYFSAENSYKGTKAWRFESQQWRMRSSFYEAKESYYENSPIFHADKITAPLLIWCGKEDTTVPASQSVALYHALRRLKKEAVLLQYKEEDHTLEDRENQKDLNVKIKQWFDHYLKGAIPKGWLKENL